MIGSNSVLAHRRTITRGKLSAISKVNGSKFHMKNSKTCSYFQRNNIGNESKVKNLIELLNKTNRHAICCAKLFGTSLSKYCGSTLINLCKQNQIYYDNKVLLPCIFNYLHISLYYWGSLKCRRKYFTRSSIIIC